MFKQLAVLVVLGAGCASAPRPVAKAEDPAPAAADEPGVRVETGATRTVTLLGPKGILELLQQSERVYDAKETDTDVAQWRQQNLAAMYPIEPGLEAPFVEVKGSSRGLRQWSMPRALMTELQRIEPLYEAGDYARAENEYEKLLARFPGEFVLYLSLGDAALFGNHPDVALPRYLRATQLNPYDHRGFYFLGNALLRLGRRDEAVAAWVRALTLRPHWDPLREGLENAERVARIELREPFLPAGRVEQTGPEAYALTTGKHPGWLAWTMCKAAWMGEPEHRKAVLQFRAAIAHQPDHQRAQPGQRDREQDQCASHRATSAAS